MTTLAAIDKQIEQLKARKQLIAIKQEKAKRAQATRQKIVIGGWVLANDPGLVERIKLGLKRDQDRVAFDMPVEKKALQPGETGSTVDLDVTNSGL